MDPVSLAAGAFRASASALFAVQGEVISEKAGIVNLGMEGCMLVGALTGYIVTYQTGNPWLGFLAGGVAGGVLALLHAYLVVTCHANQLASGLVLMFLALGLTGLIGRPYVDKSIQGFNVMPIPFLSNIPVIGPILFNHDALTYIALILTFVIWLVMYHTKLGLALRAVGENRIVAFSTGRNPVLIAYIAVVIGGVLGGFGGAHLSVAYTHSWVEGMTNGIGIIAVSLVIFGMWHPLRALLGALLFGGAVALQFQLQIEQINVSPFFLQMLPYLLTLGVLLMWGKASKRAMPAELGTVFRKTG